MTEMYLLTALLFSPTDWQNWLCLSFKLKEIKALTH